MMAGVAVVASEINKEDTIIIPAVMILVVCEKRLASTNTNATADRKPIITEGSLALKLLRPSNSIENF